MATIVHRVRIAIICAIWWVCQWVLLICWRVLLAMRFVFNYFLLLMAAALLTALLLFLPLLANAHGWLEVLASGYTLAFFLAVRHFIWRFTQRHGCPVVASNPSKVDSQVNKACYFEADEAADEVVDAIAVATYKCILCGRAESEYAITVMWPRGTYRCCFCNCSQWCL